MKSKMVSADSIRVNDVILVREVPMTVRLIVWDEVMGRFMFYMKPRADKRFLISTPKPNDICWKVP
jgi:hypothetical protein